MLIQQTLIQYLLQKKNLCEIFKVLTIWGNINLFIRPQHHNIMNNEMIKFRYHSYMEYYFDSYTREGPKIVKRQNNVN